MFRATCLRAVPKPTQRAIRVAPSIRSFRTAAPALASLTSGGSPTTVEDGFDEPGNAAENDEMWDLNDTINEFQNDDTTSMGHLILRQRRQTLKYLRLIELEVPYLQGMHGCLSTDGIVVHYQLY